MNLVPDVSLQVATARGATSLIRHIVGALALFDLLDDAPRALEEVSVRHVTGIVDPDVFVPYLVARLGRGHAAGYARALLAGRPELWPAFASIPEEGETVRPDHGDRPRARDPQALSGRGLRDTAGHKMSPGLSL